MKSLVQFLALLLASSPAMASDCIKQGFLPKNRLQIPASAPANGMTEKRFNELIDRVESHYQPIVAALGASLRFERQWNDGTVNAFASRKGSTWIVSMLGGLARHSATTEDALVLVACHEVGHHLGGAPKYRGQWAANEGQADYFSTLKCLRNIWEKDDNGSIVQGLGVPAQVTAGCEKSFGDAATIALCQRSAIAGRSTAELMRQLGGSGPIDFSTPDPAVVSATIDNHPAAQCRLDTYLGGSLCQVAKSEPLSDTDATVGTCSEEHGDRIGFRPRCWYHPEGSSQPPDGGGNGGGTSQPARAPMVMGSTQYSTHNPSGLITIEYDVSEFKQAGGIYFEMSKPDQVLAGPNGTTPDPAAGAGFAKAGARGKIQLVPSQHLPGYGSYQIRVIPLDATGKKALGRFSNPSTLQVLP